MNRRLLLVALTAFTLGMPVAAQADIIDDMVEVLEDQGYSRIEVTTTFLGRTRILASNGQGTRELVINPRTGEVLRDVWISPDGNAVPPALTRADDERDDDDDGDDDHDDHSGHGGGADDKDDDDDNSGHGGSDDDDDD
jgi:hypothetical protein